MGSRERPVDVGAASARAILARLCAEIRSARLQAGLSQLSVADEIGLSRSQFSRIERGLTPDLTIDRAVRVFAVLGQALHVQTYPAGDPIRDAAQLALLERLRGQRAEGSASGNGIAGRYSVKRTRKPCRGVIVEQESRED